MRSWALAGLGRAGCAEPAGLSHRYFFSSVVSALAGLLCMFAILSYLFVQFLVDPMQLRTDPHFAGSLLPALRFPGQILGAGGGSPVSSLQPPVPRGWVWGAEAPLWLLEAARPGNTRHPERGPHLAPLAVPRDVRWGGNGGSDGSSASPGPGFWAQPAEPS